jgi:non-homologous end joining protein Ku
MQLFWAPLAELIEARKNKKEFQPVGRAPAASNVTGLAQALQASPGAAKKLRAGGTGS